MDEFKVPSVLSKVVKSDQKIETESENKFNKTNLHKVKAECPYMEPIWSKRANQDIDYKIEVLKSGSIVEEITKLQEKPYWVIGRLADNHILMAHPTISRFHAVLQYRPKQEIQDINEDKKEEHISKPSVIEEGWYVYDLESTHGTFLNKIRIPPRTYVRMRVGHMLKLGASSRTFILQGPEFDEEPESEMSVTELKELRMQLEEEKRKREEMQREQREKEGISWGMGEDADEETDLSVNPYATTNNEELFLDDPKKTLRGFFEREGYTLEYKCDEMSPGTFVCRVELPIDDSNGRPIVAEVCHKGKKKECVVQCALESCRILDRQGVLRQSHHEPLKRKAPTADSDDEDDFLDRTGDIERKKLRKAATSSSALTYEDLLEQEKEISKNLAEVEENIVVYQEQSKKIKESKQKQDNDLDDYMENLTKESTIDKVEIRKLRVEEQRLKAEHQRVIKLIKIAKPVDLPSISSVSFPSNLNTKKTLALPLFGKRNKFKFTHLKPVEVNVKKSSKEIKSDEEEMEEDEENETKPNVENTSTIQHTSINLNKEATETNSAEKVLETEGKIKKLYGPAVIPKEILENKDVGSSEKVIDETEKEMTQEQNPAESELDSTESQLQGSTNNKSLNDQCSECENKELQENLTQEEATNSEEYEQNSSSKTKTRKTRLRNRNRRENVDMDDYAEFEDSEKHSEWLPPKNQAGDGLTSLNEKFGY